MNEDCIKKYIRVWRDGEFWLEEFDRNLFHLTVTGGRKVYSGGFFHTERKICFGVAKSIGVESTPDIDTELLQSGKVRPVEPV